MELLLVRRTMLLTQIDASSRRILQQSRFSLQTGNIEPDASINTANIILYVCVWVWMWKCSAALPSASKENIRGSNV